MLIVNERITMTEAEWQEFAEATFAPWRPRTAAEFNAMCDLGSARHTAENTGGLGFMLALAAEDMKFAADGTPNFPLDKRKVEYMRVHGTWPTEEQWEAFEREAGGTAGAEVAGVGLRRIK